TVLQRAIFRCAFALPKVLAMYLAPSVRVRITKEEVALSATDEPISFEQDIKPLFRERDRESMKGHFDLWSHDDVVRNSDVILERLRDGTMPCDGVWSSEQIAV